MSTRANIIIKDKYSKLWFYRHSDGYPDGALPTLKKFMQWLVDGKIRNNTGQAAGWLILAGADEYGYDHGNKDNDYAKTRKKLTGILEPTSDNGCSSWKCGAYEPTEGEHGDIEFLYTLDLETKTITVHDIYKKKDIGTITIFN